MTIFILANYYKNIMIYFVSPYIFLKLNPNKHIYYTRLAE